MSKHSHKVIHLPFHMLRSNLYYHKFVVRFIVILVFVQVLVQCVRSFLTAITLILLMLLSC